MGNRETQLLRQKLVERDPLPIGFHLPGPRADSQRVAHAVGLCQIMPGNPNAGGSNDPHQASGYVSWLPRNRSTPFFPRRQETEVPVGVDEGDHQKDG